MQEDETITSFPPESCVYADSQRQLMITKILLLIMMMMTIIPRKLHADPNWLKLYQLQCKRGVRQSTGNHGDTSWNQRNWIITKHVNTFLTGLNMDWSIINVIWILALKEEQTLDPSPIVKVYRPQQSPTSQLWKNAWPTHQPARAQTLMDPGF